MERVVSSTPTPGAASPADGAAPSPTNRVTPGPADRATWSPAGRAAGSGRIWTVAPVLLLALGLLLGVALWDRWGLVIALERVVQYCF